MTGKGKDVEFKPPCNGEVYDVPTLMATIDITESLVNTLNVNWKRISLMMKSMIVFRRNA